MREEFYKAYQDLYSEYVYEQNFRRRRPYLLYEDEYYIIRQIRISIDKADKENTLRPDAKYFLLVNFHHLIVRPLFEQRPYREKFYPEIEQDIDADISTIVSETKQNSEQGEISGHKIMDTINKLWKNLRTTRLELWG
ncbi:MAG: hypothetical protein ABIK31_05860 [candidate division WOR-3 bacterium]